MSKIITNNVCASENNSLSLDTQNTSRVLIDTAGNVGVGTATPSTRLHVTGAPATELRVSSTADLSTGAGTSILRFGGSNSATAGYVGYGGFSNTIDIWNTLSGPITFGTANTERARIDAAGRLTVPNQPAFNAGSAQAQVAVAANTWHFLLMEQTMFNRGNNYSTATGRFTAPVAGLYYFKVHVGLVPGSVTATVGGADAQMGVFLNGSTMLGFDAYGVVWTGYYAKAERSQIVYLNAGDYVQGVFRFTDTTQQYHGGMSSFSGYLIG